MSFQLDDLKPFIDWLHTHPGLAGLVVLLISCAESLAIVGLLIPGTIVMPAIGSMIGAHVLPGPLIIAAAIVGAIIGDGVSYWLGHHFHSHIKAYWPFNRYPRLLKSGEHFFLKYGGLSVFIGRFVGPVRPIIPVVAGMMSMTPWRFLSANITSAIAWAIVYMAPGYLLGAISEQLAPNTAARLLVILAIATLVLWLVWWLVKRVVHKLYTWLHHFAHQTWQSLAKPEHGGHWLYRCLRFPNHPGSHKPLMLLFGASASLLLFLALLCLVCWHTFRPVDIFIYYLLRSIEVKHLNYAMAVVRAFGSFDVYAVVLIALSLYLMSQRRWQALVCWLANVFSCWLLISLCKSFVPVLRPATNLFFFSNGSFPSLHGGLMMALVMGVVMLILPRIYRHRWLTVACLGCLLVAVVALPQLYFGFNWFSDEIAGILVAVVVGVAWLLIYYRWDYRSRLALKPLLWVFGLSFVLSGLVVAKVDTQAFLASLRGQVIKTPFALEGWWQGQTLPIQLVRDNLWGQPAEWMSIQYVGKLSVLRDHLHHQGWQSAPKPSIWVILNRIGAKDRISQLPLLPDLYQARKPVLVMTKALHQPERMLVLRVWATTVVMMPDGQPLWLATVQYRKPWHFISESEEENLGMTASALMLLQHDLTDFVTQWHDGPMAMCLQMLPAATCEPATLFIQSVTL